MRNLIYRFSGSSIIVHCKHVQNKTLNFLKKIYIFPSISNTVKNLSFYDFYAFMNILEFNLICIINKRDKFQIMILSGTIFSISVKQSAQNVEFQIGQSSAKNKIKTLEDNHPEGLAHLND